ncbi:MAG: SPOR domain-containing protein [Nitrospirota bacterium]
MEYRKVSQIVKYTFLIVFIPLFVISANAVAGETKQKPKEEPSTQQSQKEPLSFYEILTTKDKKKTSKDTKLKLKTQKDSDEKTKYTGIEKNIYTVQVGAFKNKSEAEKLLSTLKNKGYEAYMIVTKTEDKGLLYKVRVGELTKSKARELVKRIKEKEKIPAFVTLK